MSHKQFYSELKDLLEYKNEVLQKVLAMVDSYNNSQLSEETFNQALEFVEKMVAMHQRLGKALPRMYENKHLNRVVIRALMHNNNSLEAMLKTGANYLREAIKNTTVRFSDGKANFESPTAEKRFNENVHRIRQLLSDLDTDYPISHPDQNLPDTTASYKGLARLLADESCILDKNTPEERRIERETEELIRKFRNI